MKTKSFFLTVLFMTVLAVFMSCDDDDKYTPEDVVVNALNNKYPNAKKVEWETKSGYKVADFNLDSKEVEAWFSPDGEWVMTETNIPYNELPQTVQTSFKGSTYANWRIDDVDKLERSNAETIYIIEVEQGETDIDLYYSEDGTLIKEINDNGNNPHEPLVISQAIIDKIKEMYPNAVFLEFDKEGAFIEIDIRDGNIHKEILFDSNNEWVSTTWEIRSSDVPEIVMNTLKSSEYGNYKIDEIDIVEKPDGKYYIFELESGNKEVHLTIKSDGTIINK